MEDIIKSVSIKNFKSIKDLSFDCKKVNIFIGKPNVGKSNILEAMSLFSLPIYAPGNLNENIRLKTMGNLYYDNNPKERIEIKLKDDRTDVTAIVEEINQDFELFIGFPDLYHDRDFEAYLDFIGKNNGEFIENSYSLFSNSTYRLLFYETGELDKNRIRLDLKYSNPIRNYLFRKNIDYSKRFNKYLLPPDGQNLVTILQDNNQLFDEVQGFFEEYGLEIVVDIAKNDFEIQKRIQRRVYKYPFELMADTLQRIIFYLAAIESNSKAAIIFEEPEAHSFPPYITTLARRIGMDETNQFFISTHSPYLLNALAEDIEPDNLNIFITYFEDYQTKLQVLDNEEIRQMVYDSVDAFSNLDRFIPHL